MTRNPILRILPVILLYVFVAGLNMVMAESAKDHTLSAENIPPDWKIIYIEEQGTYAEEKECGIIDRYGQFIRTEKNERIRIVVDLFKNSEDSRRCFNEWLFPTAKSYLDSTDYIRKENIGDGGFYQFQDNDAYKFGYSFTKDNLMFMVSSTNEDVAKQAASYLLGEKYKAPGKRYAVKPGISPLPEIASRRKIPRWILPGLGSALGLGILGALAFLIKNMLAASAAKAAAVAVPKKLSIKPKAPPAKARPEIKDTKPARAGPKIKFSKPGEAPETKEKEEKKKKRLVTRIEIKAQPEEIVADGKSKARLTFKVFDSEGRSVPGETIRFQLSRDARKLPPTAVTNRKGQIHLEYTASTEERTIAIIAHSTSNPQVTQVVQLRERKPKLVEIVLVSSQVNIIG